MTETENSRAWRQLVEGRDLRALGLPINDGRVDLRGLVSPKPTLGREVKSPVRGVVELGAVTMMRDIAWKDVDLSRAELESVRMMLGEIANCRFDAAVCRDWRLWATTVTDCFFRGAKLTGALGPNHDGMTNLYTRVDFSEADLREAHFHEARFVGCQFRDTRFAEMNFMASAFTDCAFDGVTFTGPGVKSDVLKGGTMTRVDFRKARFRSVEFRGVDLRELQLPEDSRPAHSGSLPGAVGCRPRGAASRSKSRVRGTDDVLRAEAPVGRAPGARQSEGPARDAAVRADPPVAENGSGRPVIAEGSGC